MAKKSDFPRELHRFITVVNSFKGYWHDYDIFQDFLSLFVAGLSWNGNKDLSNRLTDKYKSDISLFQDLFRAYIMILHDQIVVGNRKWYDPLGYIYMEISSRSKASGLGQFFTPKEVCDFMTAILDPGEIHRETLNDCCCGSGRMLLAGHALNNNVYITAQDIDPVCVEMTCINMAYHGCRGTVICGNSLMNTVRYAYEINPFAEALGPAFYPHILPAIKQTSLSLIGHNRSDTSLHSFCNGKNPKHAKIVGRYAVPDIDTTHISF